MSESDDRPQNGRPSPAATGPKISRTSSPLASDPSGSANLVRWVAVLRSLVRDAPELSTRQDTSQFRNYFQRLVHPGITPASGHGILDATPQQSVKIAGRGPESITLLRWVDTAREHEPDAIFRQNALLGALLTLVSNRRCEVPPEVALRKEESDTVTLLPLGPTLDSSLGAPLPDWSQIDSDLRDALARLTSVPEHDDLIALSSAIHMHYSACLLHASDPSGAYALAVGGLEVLASRFGDAPSKWNDWDLAPQWNSFIAEQMFTESQSDALRGRLMKDRQIRLGETFACYVRDRLPNSFWSDPVRTYVWGFDIDKDEDQEGQWIDDENPRDPVFATDPVALRRALKRTYQARSLYLHAGHRTTSPSMEFFGEAPGRARSTLSFAQARAALRTLILIELEERGLPDADGLDMFDISHR